MTPENDKFLELLSDYDGTAQDRQKKFLVENYGYDSFMSLNDMEYAKLEELGYDGSLNDKWHKYIIALGGSGLGVKAQLLSSTFYVIIDPYKVNNFSPELTTDFISQYYRTGGSESTLTQTIIHNSATAGNATMVDSTGKIKWRPHNLLSYSEQFDNAYWTKSNVSVAATSATSAPNGTTTAYKLIENNGATAGRLLKTGRPDQPSTFAAFVKAAEWGFAQLAVYNGGAYDAVYVDLSDGSIVRDTTDGATVSSVGDGWYLVSAPYAQFENAVTICGGDTSARTLNVGTGTVSATGDGTSGIYIWGAHLYRSDLGGMADVPSAERVLPDATTYVRTAGKPIGSELVTNGTFDTDTSGWTPTRATTSLNSNALRVTSTGTNGFAKQGPISATIGKPYIYSFDIVAKGGTKGRLQIGSSNNSSSYASENTVGTFTGVFTATTSEIHIRAYSDINGSVGDYIEVDNISVKEIDVDPSTSRYLPRIGHHVYNGSQWVNEGLLHESEARTNLITDSNDFVFVWSRSGVISEIDASDTMPDGNATIRRIKEDTTTGRHDLYYVTTYTFVGNIPQTLSAYYKPDGRSNIFLRLGVSGDFSGVRFDCTGSGSILSEDTDCTGTIENVGNGWYRCSVSRVYAATTGSVYLGLRLSDGTTESYTGDGVSGGYFYGAQFEAGSTPSSYIPTSGATVDRSADTLTIEHENLPWPSPVVIGDELVTNGTFDTDVSGWNKVGDAATTFSYSSGRCLINAATTYDGISQTIFGLTVGAVYKISVDYELGTSARVGIRLTSAPTVETTDASGTLSDYVVATSTSHTMQVSSGASTGTLYVDNISVKEINPLSVSIAMDGRMTYADTDGFDVTFFSWLNTPDVIRARLYNQGTRTGQPEFYQYDGVNIDNLLGAIDTYTPNVNVPFSIASRHGSTFINGAVDGVALTANTTPTALPDLETSDLSLGYDFMGTIGSFRVWANDIADAGIVEASEPSTEPTLSLSFDGTATSFTDFEWSE